MTSPASLAPRTEHARQRGFTLLEVMCAFAILAAATAFLTRIFVQNVDSASEALSRRELREAADTIFRKMIYEFDEYKDGETRPLDEEYGKWARLKGYKRDRWAVYTFELEKKEETVVGTDPEGGDSLYGETSEEESTAAPEDGESAGPSGLKLTRMTLKIFLTEDPNREPLMVITTLVDPTGGEGQPR